MSPEQVKLVIADDGRGFDPNTVPAASYGLAGMQARLAEVGGTLNVGSVLAAGTTITAEVQLTKT
jgi:signal transduction histidine kinase